MDDRYIEFSLNVGDIEFRAGVTLTDRSLPFKIADFRRLLSVITEDRAEPEVAIMDHTILEVTPDEFSAYVLTDASVGDDNDTVDYDNQTPMDYARGLHLDESPLIFKYKFNREDSKNVELALRMVIEELEDETVDVQGDYVNYLEDTIVDLFTIDGQANEELCQELDDHQIVLYVDKGTVEIMDWPGVRPFDFPDDYAMADIVNAMVDDVDHYGAYALVRAVLAKGVVAIRPDEIRPDDEAAFHRTYDLVELVSNEDYPVQEIMDAFVGYA
jgi:hypothetical protein